MITAHGGALGTGRNSKIYFENISTFKADAIEVDVHRRGGLLYLSHLPAPFSYKKKITLAQAFAFARKNNVKINCDLKGKGLVADVIKLAKEMEVTDLLIFTGSVRLTDSEVLTEGEAWVNRIKGLPYKTKNVEKIKKALDDTKNPHFAGLNINKMYATDSFLAACKKYDVKLSIFTVDSYKELKRLVPMEPANITTNYPVVASTILFETRQAEKESK